jgi:glycosyltransferase involved in cell wall biosynthesis
MNVRCVIASTPAPFVPLQALIASRILNAKYILDVRDSWEMESFTHQGALRNRLKERVEKTCARSADLVWVVTATLLERIRVRYALRSSVLELVPNGADLSIFHAGGVERTIDVIFLGAPARYRNVAGVLESVSLLARKRPGLRAVFLGWGHVPDDANFRSAARDLRANSNVEFVRSIPRSEAARILPTTKLGIVSFSDDEIFRCAIGAKTYEYMASGVPLACLGPRGDTELGRLIESRKVGFYASSPAEFASLAARVLDDDQLWNEYSKNCVRASSDFDRRIIAQRALISAWRRLGLGSPSR